MGFKAGAGHFGILATGITLVALVSVEGCRPRSANTSRERATPEQRRLIGSGVPYTPESTLEKSVLSQNMKLRREKAWEIFRQVTRDVAIAKNAEIKGFKPDGNAVMPLWQTWYTGDELPVMFRSAYEKLTPEQRKARRPLCPDELDGLFDRHAAQSVQGLTAEDLETRLSQVRSQREVRGVSGRGITMFSPGVFRHYLENYSQVMKCPDTRQDLKAETVLSPTNHTPCFASEFPSGVSFPYGLPAGDYSHCKNQTPKVNHGGAVALKTTWHKINSEDVAIFDTSDHGLSRHITDGEWKPDGQFGEGKLSPDRMFSIKLMDSESQYHLASMHVVSKDTRDWMWMTFWWSPDPDTDFGEDRPASFKGTPWANYKMCVVTDYVEGDPDPAGHFVASQPSLAKALGKSHDMTKPYTWCSGPFTEAGKGNSRTNCIGCHQHAATAANPEEIFLDDPANPKTPDLRRLFPNSSRSQQRANFPGDYLWSYSQAPDFFEIGIRTTVSNVDNGL